MAIEIGQETLLEDATRNVRREAYFMKEKMDAGSIGLSGALHHAALMINELRAGELTPANYYDLYIGVTDELRILQDYLTNEHSRNPNIDLYEVVQYVGNVVPRVYLMITVGAIYINAGAPNLNILHDLLEMCKGVQHATRGLFLRHYLSQCAKDLLPEQSDGSSAAVDFIISNFGEVNRLWVRMQHQGSVRDRTKREMERSNLRMVVGTNLVRISQLDGVTCTVYEENVLPRLLELIVECKDKIAQEYLMECIIQVFPDEYHLATLDVFLAPLSELHDDVNSKNIIIALMDRLASFYSHGRDSMKSMKLDMFDKFQACTTSVADGLEIEDLLDLQVALLNFAVKVYPKNLEYIDTVLNRANSFIKSKVSLSQLDVKSSQHVLNMLAIPLETIALQIFELKSYSSLSENLSLSNQRIAATAVARTVIASNNTIGNLHSCSSLFGFIQPICSGPENDNDYEFDEELYLLGRLLHLIHAESTDIQFALLKKARVAISSGGDKRIGRLLPSMVFCLLSLTSRIVKLESSSKAVEISSRKCLQMVHKMISILSPVAPAISLRLWLQAATASDSVGLTEITFEFITQAFVVYEEELSGSKQLGAAISLIVGTVQSLQNLAEVDGEDYYDVLSTQATQNSARMLKKSDKVHGILECSHMFWAGSDFNPIHKGEMVLKCLKRCLKIADTTMEQSVKVELFLDILAKYLYFFSKGIPQVHANDINDLVELAKSSLLEISDPSEECSKVILKARVLGMLQHIQYRQSLPEYSDKYGVLSN